MQEMPAFLESRSAKASLTNNTKQNISVQTWEDLKGKALHKSDVWEAKNAKELNEAKRKRATDFPEA